MFSRKQVPPNLEWFILNKHAWDQGTRKLTTFKSLTIVKDSKTSSGHIAKIVLESKGGAMKYSTSCFF